jgi:thioredoxin 1
MQAARFAVLGLVLVTSWIAGCSERPAVEAQQGAAVAVVADPISQALARGKPTVVEFGANACAACRDMKQVLSALHKSHGSQIEIVEVDLLKQRDVAARYGVQLMPTQVFFAADGRQIGRNAGRIGGEEILARLGVAGAAR